MGGGWRGKGSSSASAQIAPLMNGTEFRDVRSQTTLCPCKRDSQERRTKGSNLFQRARKGKSQERKKPNERQGDAWEGGLSLVIGRPRFLSCS